MAKHNRSLMALIIVSMLTFVVTLVCNYQAGVGIGPFTQTIGEVSEKYPTNFTPAGYTFGIWLIIYTFLTAMVVYCQTTYCRINSIDSYVYVNPQVLTSTFYTSLILNLVVNVVWLLQWDREKMIYACVALALMVATLVQCLATSHVKLYDNLTEMVNAGEEGDITAIRVLVHNGLAIYASWCLVATTLNISIVLVYVLGVSMETACVSAQVGLAMVVLQWFYLETFVVYDYVLHTWSIYPTFMWALIGVLVGNWDPESTSAIVTLVLLLLVTCLLIARIIIVTTKKTSSSSSVTVSEKKQILESDCYKSNINLIA